MRHVEEPTHVRRTQSSLFGGIELGGPVR